MKQQSYSIAFAQSLRGAFPADSAARIEKFLANPTTDTWANIQGLIISPEGRGIGTSVWQAMLKFDPTFPAKGRSYRDNVMVRDWARIPTPDELRQALFNTIMVPSINNN